MRLIVTGVAGFIGLHAAKRLLLDRAEVLGIDSLTSYYDVTLKEARLKVLAAYPNFAVERVDLVDSQATQRIFERFRPEMTLHLAAQAGVRYSLQNPQAYVDSNLRGFLNVLEGCRHNGVRHLVYASSSSVYGANSKVPFTANDNVDHPVSFYAATKRANELMSHAYSHVFDLPCTGLRFFTVYGPWGRPDMAPFLFTRAILEKRPIDVYNYGEMERDFTYVDDVVEGIARVLPHIPSPASNGGLPSASAVAPYRLYNIGNHKPVSLLRFINILEECLGTKAQLNLLPMQPGDVRATWADVSDLMRDVGYAPDTPLETGLAEFVRWYESYY